MSFRCGTYSIWNYWCIITTIHRGYWLVWLYLCFEANGEAELGWRLGGWSLSAGEVVENLDVSWVSCLARRLEMTGGWAGQLG